MNETRYKNVIILELNGKYCVCLGEYNKELCTKDPEHPTRYKVKTFKTLVQTKKAIDRALL